MDLLEHFFRFSGISLFLLMGLLVLRDISDRKTAILGFWAALSGASYLVCTYPPLRTAVGPLMPVVDIFCHSGQIAIWLFSLSQFRDRLKLWPGYILVAAGFYLTTRIYWEVYIGEESIEAYISLAANAVARFGMIAHMVYVAWEGRTGDLIEVRRKFRSVYIVTVSLATLAVAFAETVFSINERSQPEIYLLQSIGFCMLAFILVWYIVDLKKNALFVGTVAAKPMPKSVDAAERHDLDSIKKLVEGNALYLEPGLTIALLADKAGLPEHRLRRLINQHLGYRNFADFLNHYRIEAAKERLASIEDRNIPVLTVAMDLGYGSLGPFNRAFKDRTGQTPTEYRKNKLADL